MTSAFTTTTITTSASMSLSRVYIAGPMRNIPEYNFPAFFEAEERFAQEGWLVTNPARMDVELDGSKPDGTDIVLQAEAVYMRRDLPAVIACSAIAMLPGWESSSGATKELQVAEWCGLSILDAVTMGPLERESIAQEAHRLVFGPRQQSYGHPLDDLTRTGRLWGALLGIADVPAETVALCMVAVKLSRQVNAPKRDNLVDAAGYALVAQLAIAERERRG